MAELWNGCPLFAGDGDIDQLSRVVSAMGAPVQNGWPEAASLPDYHKIEFTARVAPQPISALVPDAAHAAAAQAAAAAFTPPSPPIPAAAASSSAPSASVASTSSPSAATAAAPPPASSSATALDLLTSLLAYAPHRRITARAALKHPWFQAEPAPASDAALARLAALPVRRNGLKVAPHMAPPATDVPLPAPTSAAAAAGTSVTATLKPSPATNAVDADFESTAVSLRDCLEFGIRPQWKPHMHAQQQPTPQKSDKPGAAATATTTAAGAAATTATSQRKPNAAKKKSFAQYLDFSLA
jgi:serine/threonine protein kinase